MNCWKCHKTVELAQIGFRAVCKHCDADLHVCKNCKYYQIGKPNDCIVPGTDFVADREKSNLCEEFRPKPPEQKSERPRHLFKDDEIKKPKSFKDLFDDS